MTGTSSNTGSNRRAETDRQRRCVFTQAGPPGTETTKDKGACIESDVRGRNSNVERNKSLAVIPSCMLGMSSLFFEAFPHNKRIKHKRNIVKKEREKMVREKEALNHATYYQLQC